MFFNKAKEKIINWFFRNVEGKRASFWLSVISFTESSIFPIPPDPFLIAILFVKKNHWLRYSLLVGVMSVIGGVFGYFIGLLFYDLIGSKLVSIYHLEGELSLVREYFNDNAFVAIFTAAFTPIPYKLFTISAGLFNINLFIFILASILGRFTRFLLIGFLMRVFGERIYKVVIKYTNLISIVIAMLIIFYVVFRFL